MNRSEHSARRLLGKSGPLDARTAARAVLSGRARAIRITLSLLAQRIKQLTGQIDWWTFWPYGRLQPSLSETLSCSMGMGNR